MRFGKRLGNVSMQSASSLNRFVSYKQLKRIIKAVLLRSMEGQVEDIVDVHPGAVSREWRTEVRCSDPSISVLKHEGYFLQVRELKYNFFRSLTDDTRRVSGVIKEEVQALEPLVGEVQLMCIKAGFLSPPAEILSSSNWSGGNELQPLEFHGKPKLEKAVIEIAGEFSIVLARLNELLNYVEINCIAVRKILKKFEKKTGDFSSAEAISLYGELLLIPLQRILVAADALSRLILDLCCPSSSLSAELQTALASMPSLQLVGSELFIAAGAVGGPLVDALSASRRAMSEEASIRGSNRSPESLNEREGGRKWRGSNVGLGSGKKSPMNISSEVHAVDQLRDSLQPSVQ